MITRIHPCSHRREWPGISREGRHDLSARRPTPPADSARQLVGAPSLVPPEIHTSSPTGTQLTVRVRTDVLVDNSGRLTASRSAHGSRRTWKAVGRRPSAKGGGGWWADGQFGSPARPPRSRPKPKARGTLRGNASGDVQSESGPLPATVIGRFWCGTWCSELSIRHAIRVGCGWGRKLYEAWWGRWG